MTATWAKPLRLFLSVCLGAMLVVLGVLASPMGDSSAEGADTSWTVRTASNDYGAQRTSFSYTIDPGSRITDAMIVVNNGADPLTLSVYAADGYTTDTGVIDLLVGDETSAAIGAWTRSETETITLAGGESAEIPFSLQIPDDATPGDYAGGIVTSLGGSADASGISTDRRLGILMTVRVTGDLAPSLAIDDAQISWNGGFNPFALGGASMTYTLRNTGNVTMTAQQTAAVSGPFGWGAMDAGEITAAPKLLPGESWTVTVAIDDVPALFWLTGDVDVIPVVLDASGSLTALSPVTATVFGWAVPWALVVLIVLLAGLAVFAVRLLRRSRARRQAKEDARVQEAVDLALADAQGQTQAQDSIPVA